MKYHTKADFFEEIDSQEKAYIFGFICGDGYNHESNRIVAIRINDLDLLEDIRDIITPDRPIYKVKNSNSHLLSISSVALSKSLARAGCEQNKSSSLDFPDTLPTHLVHHFVRGYFDADGSVYRVKKSHRLGVNIIATEAFCNSLLSVIPFPASVRNRTYTAMSDWRMMRQSDIIGFRDWLYKDSVISLKRKRDVFFSIEIDAVSNKILVRDSNGGLNRVSSSLLGREKSDEAKAAMRLAKSLSSGVFIEGKPISFVHGCKHVGKDSKTVYTYMKKHGLSKQEALDHYLRLG